jgi:hypothetical protein
VALIGKVWLSDTMLPALAALTDTHRTTVMRWYRRRQLPRAVYLLLQLLWHGRIELVHSAWQGFRITKSGELETPAGWTVTAGEIAALLLRYQEISALRADAAAQHRQLAIMTRELLADPAQFDVDRAPRATVGGRAGRNRRDHRNNDHPPVHGLRSTALLGLDDTPAL